MTVDIPNDKLILSFDQDRQQSSMPTRIQALVIVHQRLDSMTYLVSSKVLLFFIFLDVTLKPLGYCRFPLYIPQKIGNLDTWDVTVGPVRRVLHSGLPPVSIDTIPDTPKPFVAGT